MLGVVAAGGRSHRMGRDKAFVDLAHRPLIAWVVDALESQFERVLIAGRIEGWEGRAGLEDAPQGAGPLAGLVAALALDEPVLFAAVDQAWLRPATLSQLAKRPGLASVPVADGKRQVTCAVYSPRLLESATAELAAGGSLQTLLDHAEHEELGPEVWSQWGEDGRSWFSVDNEAFLEEGLRRYGPPAKTVH